MWKQKFQITLNYIIIYFLLNNVEILEPKEIKNQFKNMINEIAKKYI